MWCICNVYCSYIYDNENYDTELYLFLVFSLEIERLKPFSTILRSKLRDKLSRKPREHLGKSLQIYINYAKYAHQLCIYPPGVYMYVCVCVYIHVCATYLSCKESNHVTALSSSESLGSSTCCCSLLLLVAVCRFRFFVLLLCCCCVYGPPLLGLFCRCYISIFCILYVSFPEQLLFSLHSLNTSPAHSNWLSWCSSLLFLFLFYIVIIVCYNSICCRCAILLNEVNAQIFKFFAKHVRTRIKVVPACVCVCVLSCV